MAIALDGKVGDWIVETLDSPDVVFVQHRLTARQVPTDQFYGQSAAHDDARSLRIDPDVVLRCRCYVAFAAWRSSHDDATSDFRRDVGSLGDCESNIGQRRQRDDDQPRIRINRLDYGIGGMFG